MLRIVLILCGLLQAVPALAECPRIVSQSPYLTIALDWLGQGSCVVGVSRYDRKDDLPKTGGVFDPDAAAIAALKPGLIVTPDWIAADDLAKVTPPGARALRLGGFASMNDAEAMLNTLAEASGAPGGRVKVAEFARDWRARAARVGGGGKRVLLLSACEGSPYSYGAQTTVADLFTHAGFVVVETDPKIRSIGPGAEIQDLKTLVERMQPDVVFNFSQPMADRCDAAFGTLPVRRITLNGEHFVHPGPRLLQGLDDLIEEMSW